MRLRFMIRWKAANDGASGGTPTSTMVPSSVQLSTLGTPIVGDNKYGYPRGSLKNSISLHARRLRFIHPIKKEPVEIVAALPKDGFWEKFEGMVE